MTTLTPTLANFPATVDLGAIDLELRAEHAYDREGHTARTLRRAHDLRVVLMAMRAGSRMAPHHIGHSVSVQVLFGLICVHISDDPIEIGAGQALFLADGVTHDVVAKSDSSFVLTFPWLP